MIIQAPAPSGGATYVLNNVYKFGSAAEAEVFGVNAAFDVTSTAQIYQAIAEFFEVNPTGTLYVQFTAQTATPVEMLTPSLATSAIKLINTAEGKIKQLGVVFNPSVAPADYEAALTAAIAQANLFALNCHQNNRPIHIVLEGLGATGATNTRTALAKHVSVMLGQNDAFYSLGAWAQKHTSLGRALGVVSLAKVNESIAWVGKYNLLAGAFSAARVNGVLMQNKTAAELDTLNTNGYLYFISITDYPGLYMNASYSCTTATDDYSTIEKNRTWNKAARLVRQAMLPFVNSTVFVDATSGLIDPTTVAVMEAAGNKALRQMFQAGEISGPDPQGPNPPVQIDPNQDVLSTSEMTTQVSIVPTGVAEIITNYIGFTNPNN
jgi:hypothetical protein